MARRGPKPIEAKLTHDHPFFGILEDAYSVFDDPKPGNNNVCEGCCMNPEIERDFFNPPMRDRPLNYFQDRFYAAYELDGVSKRTLGLSPAQHS